MKDPLCKGCWEKTDIHKSISQQEVADALAQLAKGKHIRFTDDDLYAYRLQQCQSCSYLEYQTTCLKCGCYVRIRAKLADAACPLSKNKKW